MSQAEHVYLIGVEGGKVKIGRSAADVELRIQNVVSSLPVEMVYVHAIKTSDCKKLEAHYHKKYKEHHVRGEWYQLPESVVDELLQLYEMELLPAPPVMTESPKLLTKMEKRNKEILRLRLIENWTYDRIAKEFGVSKQRVYQIVNGEE